MGFVAIVIRTPHGYRYCRYKHRGTERDDNQNREYQIGESEKDIGDSPGDSVKASAQKGGGDADGRCPPDHHVGDRGRHDLVTGLELERTERGRAHSAVRVVEVPFDGRRITPVAGDDTLTTNEDTPLTITVATEAAGCG